MKHLKLMLVVAVMAMGSVAFANPGAALDDDRNSVSYEIEKILKDSNLVIEKEFKVKVVFILSEDRKIQIHSVKSENEEVNQFLRKRLQNKELTGKGWNTGKYYELPVKVEIR